MPELNPLLCSLILEAKNESEGADDSSKLTLLLAMSVSVMMTEGCLKASTSFNTKPTKIWKQTGFLHSALDILVRAKIIEEREATGRVNKKSVSHSKKISHHNEDE